MDLLKSEVSGKKIQRVVNHHLKRGTNRRKETNGIFLQGTDGLNGLLCVISTQINANADKG